MRLGSGRRAGKALLDGSSCDDASVQRFCSEDDGQETKGAAKSVEVKVVKETMGAEAQTQARHGYRVLRMRSMFVLRW